MNYICTWLCADEKGDESIFPQTGKLSSSQSHQNIYWRCVVVFYATSRRFNKHEKHVLFTNVAQLPVVDGKKMETILKELDVEVIHTGFEYKTPKGYFGKFQNQFYEFSILAHIARHNTNSNDQYLILDSDCIFIKPVKQLFAAAAPTGFISFEDDVLPDYVINGLSRNDMKAIYEELLGNKIQEIPSYHLGEFLLCSVGNINNIFNDFVQLWPQLKERNELGLKKFNEEAHTLSYLYFKNGFRASKTNPFMKRIWTNPLFYRNVSGSDVDLCIWHLPSEKTFGIERLYHHFMNAGNYGLNTSNESFTELVQKTLGIPYLPVMMKVKYYVLSYYRAGVKRLNKLPLSVKFN